MKGRAVIFWGAGALVLLVVALVAGAPPGDGVPLDPSSTGPSGTRALALLLDELGADVDIRSRIPATDHDVALLLEDLLRDQDDDAVLGWVQQGGTLVVADPFSSLTPSVAGTAGVDLGIGAAPSIARGECDLDALRGLERIDPLGGVLYDVPSGAAQCFGDGDGGAYVVARAEGDGVVVSVGGAGAFTNQALGTLDNSVLAANLLVPRVGASIAILRPGAFGEGEETLSDLVARRVKDAILQLGVAFALYALWRARRLGKPVPEPQPVQLAGSELVSAVGHLLQQARSPSSAAATLRRDLRRALTERLGLPPGAEPEVVADVTAARTGIERGRVLAAVRDVHVANEAELIALAQSIESIRQEVLHGERV